MDSLGLKSQTVLHNLGVKCSEIQSDVSKNLIQCVENWLFVFNPDDSSIVVSNLSQEPSSYQTLVPSPPPPFQVTSFKINPTLTYCAYVGASGLALMDLPNTRGIGGGFAFGKEKTFCRCVSLDERHFVCHPSLQIAQARWHPHAPGDDLLLVLTSANDLRLYCGRSGRASSHRVDSAPAPAATLTSLGHVTVDFQFLPARFKGDEESGELEFPILVLFQDGEVHMVNMIVNHDNLIFAPQSVGSLPFLPYSSENYAEDASSLLVLPSHPPLICIATSTGTLYHCILFENEAPEDEDTTWHGVGSVSHAPFSLHVTEVVELKLGCVVSDEEAGQMFCSAVHLHADIGNISRYFCFHKSGVHIVKVPLVDEVSVLADADDNDYESLLPQFSSSRCHTEHLLYIGTTDDTPDHLGFTVCHLPRALILLLGNGEFVSATLHSRAGITMGPGGLDEQLADKLTIAGTRKSENYANYIASMLSSCDNIPLLRVDPNASFTDDDIKQIYSKNMEVLVQQILPQLDLASQNIIEKVNSLKKMQADVLSKTEEYARIQAECKETAEKLAEKYEDINERHEELMIKCQHVLISVYSKCNSDPVEEEYFHSKLEAYQSRVDKLSQQLNEIRNIEEQAKAINLREVNSSESLHLNPNKEKVLKEVLNEVQSSIQSLILKVSETREDVDSLRKHKQQRG